MASPRFLTLLLALLAFTSATQGYLAPLGLEHPEVKYEPFEYMVQLRDDTRLEAHVAQVRGMLVGDSQIFKTFNINHGDFVAYSARLTPELLAKIRTFEEVLRIEPNAHVELMATQLDPINWGLDRIDQRNLPLNDRYVYADLAGEGVDAYIIDTGINVDHIEFSNGNVKWGITTPRNSEDRDLNGHGTHVASTVCGRYAGVAKKSTCIAVKVMKDSGLGTVFDITEGVSWVAEAHKNGTNKSVANMSLGSPISNPIIDASVAALARSGVIVVVAAGNSDRNACNGSPAGQADMITVGAVDSNDFKPDFSNWGECVDFFAPGVNITAAWFEGPDAYYTASGTSMASPHGCGVAALILAGKPLGFSQEEMRAELLALATPNILSNIGTGSPNLMVFTNPPPSV